MPCLGSGRQSSDRLGSLDSRSEILNRSIPFGGISQCRPALPQRWPFCCAGDRAHTRPASRSSLAVGFRPVSGIPAVFSRHRGSEIHDCSDRMARKASHLGSRCLLKTKLIAAEIRGAPNALCVRASRSRQRDHPRPHRRPVAQSGRRASPGSGSFPFQQRVLPPRRSDVGHRHGRPGPA